MVCLEIISWTAMKDIHIVFVHYFMRDDLLAAIQSVLADMKTCPYQAQLTVVDNSLNQDGVKEALAKTFGDSVLYVNPGANVGFGAGNMIGFNAAPARYYFALNPDTIIPANTKVVQRLVEFMDRHPRIGCIGPKLINLDGSIQYSCYRFDLPSMLTKPFKQLQFSTSRKVIQKRIDRSLMRDFDHNQTRPVDWIMGSAMFVRAEVVTEIGFDPRYFMYLEDCDWCRTMWSRGWPVYYAHDIVIQHRHARESAKVPGIVKALCKNKMARAHLKSWVQYMWKWRGTFRYYF